MTQGYASFDYEQCGYEKSKIIKLEMRINEDPVDAFSTLVHASKAEAKGRQLCKRLKEILPKQQFKVPIQAAIGGKIIARETISALSKNVTAKCYGGDITRKRKLLEKQKKGKAKMKKFGKVSIPQSAFIEILKSSDKLRALPLTPAFGDQRTTPFGNPCLIFCMHAKNNKLLSSDNNYISTFTNFNYKTLVR